MKSISAKIKSEIKSEIEGNDSQYMAFHNVHTECVGVYFNADDDELAICYKAENGNECVDLFQTDGECSLEIIEWGCYESLDDFFIDYHYRSGDFVKVDMNY